MNHEAQFAAIEAELRRLHLSLSDLPGLAFATEDAMAHFLALLRTKAPGVTWKDLLPTPPGWDPTNPATYTRPFRPLGPWDYQVPPVGPAIHVIHPTGEPETWLTQLAEAMVRAGLPVYASGRPTSTAGWTSDHGMVVLVAGTTEDTFADALSWLETKGGVTIATTDPRTA